MHLPTHMTDFNEKLIEQRQLADDIIRARADEVADYLVLHRDFQKIKALNVIRAEFGYDNSLSHQIIKDAIKRAGFYDPVPQAIYQKALDLVATYPGEVVVPIKALREEFNLSLKESKRIIDAARRADDILVEKNDG